MTADQLALERYREIARQIADDPGFRSAVHSICIALHESNALDTASRRALVGEIVVTMRAGLGRFAGSLSRHVPPDEIEILVGATVAAAIDAVTLMPFDGGTA